MKLKKHLRTTLLLALGGLTLAACGSDKEGAPETVRQPVNLKAEIFTINAGEAAIWKGGQAVGIYMLKENTNEVVDTYANVKYVADNRGTTGYLVPADNQPMYYPADGSNVDFKVYYPYNPEVEQTLRAVEAYTEVRVDEHTAPDGFLYSRNAKGSNANTEASTVQIKSMLSQVSIDFHCTLDGASKLEAHIKNIATRARFDLMQGMFVEYTTEEDAVLPMTGTKNTVGGNTVFSMSSVIFSGQVPEKAQLEVIVKDSKDKILKEYLPIALTKVLEVEQQENQVEENTQYNIDAQLTEREDITTQVSSTASICIMNWNGSGDDADINVARPTGD